MLFLASAGLAALATIAMATRNPRPQQQPYADFEPLPATQVTPVLQEAQHLWPHAPEEALGLLSRSLLARLEVDYHLVIPAGATEPEILERVATLRLGGLEDFTRRLTQYWQQASYAGEMPSDAAWASLCASWQRLFPDDGAA